MPADSPSISTLTISPLVTKRKSRDYFQTPPNGFLPNQQSRKFGNRLFSSPSTRKLATSNPSKLDANITASSTHLQDSTANPELQSRGASVLGAAESTTQIEGASLEQGGVEDNDDDEGDMPMSQADKLRLWRHDALLQHHYNTAIYIGDKVLSLTNDPNDAFWLAQVHYSNGNYQIARNLLAGPKFEDSVSCRYLTGLCLVKLEKLDEALDIIGEVNPFKKDHSIKNPDE
ncbi:unnamed protein product [Ambrosiozyma monospora]|uniref:Unnamed protein product n=1 Tax=Ambrosiozyma monospora TaxID=43982 RepID=A0A9W7DLA9_AMBMO|nr:unnamed protein product [Ambrosiozyma monospora]